MERTRIRTLPLLIAGALPATAGLLAQGSLPGFTSADLHALKTVSDVHVAPDGAHIAYVMSTWEKSGAPAPGLWVYDVAAGTHTQVGDSSTGAASPRWSPDSKWIAFLGRADTRPGLVIVR